MKQQMNVIFILLVCLLFNSFPVNANVQLLDGSFTAQIAKHAAEPINEHPLWSSKYLCTDHESCVQAHYDFIEAGADIIQTNSYQANLETLMKTNNYTIEDAAIVLQNSVFMIRHLLEQENKTNTIKIAGSIGPYGVKLRDGSEYNGHYTDSMTEYELINWHRPQMTNLVEAGVAYLAIETIPSEKEAVALAKLLKEFPQQKAWISFSCKDDQYTSHGELLSSAVKKCLDINPEQIVAVGVNCIKPKHVSNLIKSIKSVNSTVQTIAYPNKGGVWDSENMKWNYPEGEHCVLYYVPQWLKEGVNIIGGCCDVTADDIAEMRNIIDDFNAKQNSTSLNNKLFF